MKKITFEVVLDEMMLGTKPNNPQIYADYIANKAEPDKVKDEIDAAEKIKEDGEKGITVFHRDDDGTPILWDYQVKGFFKDACGSLRRATDTKSASLKAYKSVIDSCVFVNPRKVRIEIPEGGKIECLERPLRAETMQGPRVTLAKSETVPAGSKIKFEVTLLNDGLLPVVEEWMDYGKLRGLGQWRNAGYGRFHYAVEK